MAGTELIVDDEFCKAMGEYYVKQGERLDQVLSKYLTILNDIQKKGIKKGEVAEALSMYITLSKKLCKQFENVSSVTKTHVTNFLSKIDSADQYLF